MLLFVNSIKVSYEDARSVMACPLQICPKLPSISYTMKSINKDDLKFLPHIDWGNFCGNELLMSLTRFKFAPVMSPANPNSPLCMMTKVGPPISFIPKLFIDFLCICFFDLSFHQTYHNDIICLKEVVDFLGLVRSIHAPYIPGGYNHWGEEICGFPPLS